MPFQLMIDRANGSVASTVINSWPSKFALCIGITIKTLVSIKSSPCPLVQQSRPDERLEPTVRTLTSQSDLICVSCKSGWKVHRIFKCIVQLEVAQRKMRSFSDLSSVSWVMMAAVDSIQQGRTFRCFTRWPRRTFDGTFERWVEKFFRWFHLLLDYLVTK